MAYVIKLFDAQENVVWSGIAAQPPTEDMLQELWQLGYRFWSVGSGKRRSIDTPVSELELEEEATGINLSGLLTLGTGIPASVLWGLNTPNTQIVVIALTPIAALAFIIFAVLSAQRYVRIHLKVAAPTSSFFTQQHILPLSEYQQDMLAWAVETEANLRSPFKRLASEILLGHETAPVYLDEWYILWGDQAYQLVQVITEDAELQRLYDVSSRLTSSTSRGVHSFALSLRQATQLGRTMAAAAERVRGYYLASQQVQQAAIDALDNHPELER